MTFVSHFTRTLLAKSARWGRVDCRSDSRHGGCEHSSDERREDGCFNFHLNSVYVESSDGVLGTSGTDKHYISKVYLYGRDHTGQTARIRVWTEFAAIGHPGRAQADALAVHVAHDLLRHAIRPIISSIGLGPVDSRCYPEIDPFRFDFSYIHRKPRPLRRDNDLLHDVCELTAVFWRGEKELWATASTQGKFRARMKRREREHLLIKQCEALFESAASLEPEELASQMVSAPDGSTDATCF